MLTKNNLRKTIFSFMVVLGIVLISILLIDCPVHAASSIAMYRLYNHNSGEHFYTKDTNERDHLVSVGWKYEGIGWSAPTSGKPVYRLYNQNGGEHHYTVDNNEKNHLVRLGWKDEGVGWYSGGNVPVYREYNPNARANNHNYTPNKNEHNHLIALGWRNENIGWYGVSGTPTKEQGNALEKAIDYAGWAHMSKKRLYEQLTSKYGERFSADAAQYAIDHLNIDYNQSALEKAKSYQDDMHMSKQAIYEQLVSEYGENFTPSEAQYAINHLPN